MMEFRMACCNIKQEWKIRNHLGEIRLRWLGHFERMGEIIFEIISVGPNLMVKTPEF